jgi:hypothetical protein
VSRARRASFRRRLVSALLCGAWTAHTFMSASRAAWASKIAFHVGLADSHSRLAAIAVTVLGASFHRVIKRRATRALLAASLTRYTTHSGLKNTSHTDLRAAAPAQWGSGHRTRTRDVRCARPGATRMARLAASSRRASFLQTRMIRVSVARPATTRTPRGVMRVQRVSFPIGGHQSVSTTYHPCRLCRQCAARSR